MRVVDELAEWVDAYAAERKIKRGQVVEMALENLRDLAQGGVPDAPSTPVPQFVKSTRAQQNAAPAVRPFSMDAQRKLNEAKYGRKR